MKPLELTKEQKDKLLDMCNSLFPKEGVFFTINCGDIYYSDRGKYPGETIHWFEFCWKILNKICEKIKSPIEITKKVEIFGLICFNNFESQHPVDYLYSEFKKLK